MSPRLLLPVLPLLLLCACEESRNQQRAGIRKSFQDFSKAFFGRDGKSAINHLSKNTFLYYDRIIPLARYQDDAGLSNLPPVDLLACLSLRHRYSARELRSINSRKIVLDALDRMTFPAGAPHFLGIGDIRITIPGKQAIAPVLLAPGEWHQDIKVSFVKENGEWKIDPTSIFPAMAGRIEPHLLDPTVSRAEKALYYLEIHENEHIGRELLSPRP